MYAPLLCSESERMRPESLGDMIQEARMSRYKLREFAKLVGISATHLSDIENDRRVPSESVLLEIAQHLDLDADTLMVAARRVPEDTKRYVEEVPEAVSLFRTISNKELRTDELKLLKREADRLVRKRKTDQ